MRRAEHPTVPPSPSSPRKQTKILFLAHTKNSFGNWKIGLLEIGNCGVGKFGNWKIRKLGALIIALGLALAIIVSFVYV